MMAAAVLDSLNRVEHEDEEDDDLGCPSSSSSSLDSANSNASSSSSSSYFMDDATSSSHSPASSSSRNEHEESPLFEMSVLMEDLPIKRGLSRHFEGKSQSFTSLANARCLEDLVKPVRTTTRKRGAGMKACRSYGGGLDAHKPLSPKEGIAKKASRGSLASLVGGLRRSGFAVTGRPPVHPHGSGGLSSQALLFA